MKCLVVSEHCRRLTTICICYVDCCKCAFNNIPELTKSTVTYNRTNILDILAVADYVIVNTVIKFTAKTGGFDSERMLIQARGTR